MQSLNEPSDDVLALTTYLAYCGWQVLAFMLHHFSFLFFVLPKGLMTDAFYVALFLVFVGCEFMSFKRKTELEAHQGAMDCFKDVNKVISKVNNEIK